MKIKKNNNNNTLIKNKVKLVIVNQNLKRHDFLTNSSFMIQQTVYK